jgi:hypothetical protein
LPPPIAVCQRVKFMTFYFFQPSMAGKSSMVLEMLKFRKQLFTTEFSKIIYCVPERHLDNQRQFLTSLTRVCPEVEIRGGQVNYGDIRGTTLPKLIVFDDYQLSMNTELLDTIFSQDSHHYSTSCILVLHDYFQSKTTRTLYRSVNYRFIFNDIGNQRYIQTISMQTLANPMLLTTAFVKLERYCPNLRFQCLLLDSHPMSPLKQFSVRGNFLPDKDGKVRPLLFKTV